MNEKTNKKSLRYSDKLHLVFLKPVRTFLSPKKQPQTTPFRKPAYCFSSLVLDSKVWIPHSVFELPDHLPERSPAYSNHLSFATGSVD